MPKNESNSSQISNFIYQAAKTLEDNFNSIVTYIKAASYDSTD